MLVVGVILLTSSPVGDTARSVTVASMDSPPRVQSQDPPTTAPAPTTDPTVPAPPATPSSTIPVAQDGVRLGNGPYRVATPIRGPLAVFEQPDQGDPIHQLPHPASVSDVAVDQVLLVLSQTPDSSWYQVLLPIRPNGSTGWIRSSDVRTVEHDWRIEVSVSDFRIRVFKGPDEQLNVPIAVARANAPTPGGLFYTTTLLQPPDRNGPYGPYAYVLSGFSNVFESYAGGPGQLGIHGTNNPSSIGTRASSGCIRLHNDDIAFLAERLPVGVPVQIEA